MSCRLASRLSRPSTLAMAGNGQIASFLLPFAHQHVRCSSILTSLKNTAKSYKHKKRLGRGPASGKGRTSGRGMNGQKARGKVPFKQNLGRHFEGGQTPYEHTHKSPGQWNGRFSLDIAPLNLSKLITWIETDRIDPTRPITPRELLQSRCISSPKDGIKLLATGKESLRHPLRIITSRASRAAIASVEAAGGKIQTRYYTPFAFRQIMRGTMDPVHSIESRISEEDFGKRMEVPRTLESHSRSLQPLKRLPDPIQRKVREYYRDPEHRGYLSYTVNAERRETPSLYFKVPPLIAAAQKPLPLEEMRKKELEKRERQRKKRSTVDNRVF